MKNLLIVLVAIATAVTVTACAPSRADIPSAPQRDALVVVEFDCSDSCEDEQLDDIDAPTSSEDRCLATCTADDI